MSWFSVLKMPNPHGGKWADLTRDEYYEMDDINKKNYHMSMKEVYKRQLIRAVTPRKAGQAPPATDDQIRELREQERFHQRHERRIARSHGWNTQKITESEKENYFSLEEENYRMLVKPRYDAVERSLNTTKEMYDNYTRDEKIRYWKRLAHRFNNEELGIEANRLRQRMRSNPNYNPPFEGDELKTGEYRDANVYRDISEYNEFTDDEKRRYHSRMVSRFYRQKENKLGRFHKRMYRRTINKLPTYPTPEDEENAT